MSGRRTFAFATAAVLLYAAPASAQDADKCQPVTLISDDEGRSIEAIDVQGDGPSSGDWRIGTRRLLDQDGNEVGYRRWIAVALDPPPNDGDQGQIMANIVLRLADGQIHIQTFIDAGRPIHTEGSVYAQDEQGQGVVLGGTGAYAFARGTYLSSSDGDKRVYTLDIRCD